MGLTPVGADGGSGGEASQDRGNGVGLGLGGEAEAVVDLDQGRAVTVRLAHALGPPDVFTATTLSRAPLPELRISYKVRMGTAQIPDPTESVRHQLRPLFDQIVIKELDQDRVRRSGLVVPPGTHELPPEQGIVLAVGPGLDWWAQAGVEMPVQPGDHVVFPAAAGAWVEIDEERLLVCRVTQLLGVLESASLTQ
jgi:chaperonin GroES